MIKELGKDKRILCIYHGDCSDGFTAAWVVNKWALEHGHDVEYHPGVYGEELPDVNFRHVIMVDFSYNEEMLIEMSEESASITILDHHKTAQEALTDIESELYCAADIIFDMNKAGCQLAWEYFFDGVEIPEALVAVGDRDLWLFDYTHTAEITAYVFLLEHKFENWDFIMDNENLGEVIERGETLLKKQNKDINGLFDSMVQYKEFGGYKVAVANVAWMFASDLGNKMCTDCENIDFAITYFQDKKGIYQLSFRSTDKLKDASEVAKLYGGGGHRNACGAKVTNLPWEKSYIQVPITENDGEDFRILGASGGSLSWCFDDQNGHPVDIEFFKEEDEEDEDEEE